MLGMIHTTLSYGRHMSVAYRLFHERSEVYFRSKGIAREEWTKQKLFLPPWRAYDGCPRRKALKNSCRIARDEARDAFGRRWYDYFCCPQLEGPASSDNHLKKAIDSIPAHLGAWCLYRS